MILDLDHFIEEAQPRWRELASLLDRLEQTSLHGDLTALERCYQLYEKACADLAKLSTFAAAPEVQQYLDSLVARAYAEIHETRRRPLSMNPWRLLVFEFPRAFRRQRRAFALTVVTTLVGAGFGMLVMLADPAAKDVLLPFPHLQQDPSQRVHEEETTTDQPLGRGHASFSAQLIQHNTRVGIFSLALGMTFGIGTVVLLFYNGVILGAVCLDYLAAGEGVFLAGWLLPHGCIEIPAILIAAQAGLVLARALLDGRAQGQVAAQLRAVRADLVALSAGFATLLVWAGLIESFVSQTHQPFLSYPFKITFGLLELALLTLFLARAGLRSEP